MEPLGLVSSILQGVEHLTKLWRVSYALRPMSNQSVQDFGLQIARQSLVWENTISSLILEAEIPATSIEWDEVERNRVDPQVDEKLRNYLGGYYGYVVRTGAELERDLQEIAREFHAMTGSTPGGNLDSKSARKMHSRWKKIENLMRDRAGHIDHYQWIITTIITGLEHPSREKLTSTDAFDHEREYLREEDEEQEIDDDTASLYSIETVRIGTDRELSYLSISLKATTECETPWIQHAALLDTGASANCIREDLANQLGLPRRGSDEELWTVDQRYRLIHNGVSTVHFTWIDADGNLQQHRTEMYRILVLTEPMILSHGFVAQHQNIWSVAKRVAVGIETIAIIGLQHLTKEQRKAERIRQDKTEEENRKREEQDFAAARAARYPQRQPPDPPASSSSSTAPST